MAALPLQKGTVIDFRGRRYTSGGRGPGGGFLLIPHKGRSNQVLKPEAAFDALATGQLSIVQETSQISPDGEPIPSMYFDLDCLDECERDLVLMRHFYMVRLNAYREEGGKLSDAPLNDFALRIHADYLVECRKKDRDRPKTPMSAAALRRWFKRWNESGFKIESLVRDAKGNSHSKLTHDQEDMLYQAIHHDYMDRSRITARTTHTRMCARIRVENRARSARGELPIPTPSYNTLLRHLKTIDLFEKLEARYSKAYAMKATRFYRITPPCRQHLERVQVDHTLLDIYVDFGHDILVRPWITLVLDSYSKAILGYWITPEPASAQSVMQALKMAILPKNLLELGGEPDWHWPMHGIPGELTLDNGKEFHGVDLEMAACELGITLSFTPPRSPWHKAQVERKFGEINRSLLAQMPGQVFKYEPEKYGMDYPHLTLDEFQRIFLQWVTTVLHRTPNRNGETPEQLWYESVSKHGTPGSGMPPDFVAMCLSKSADKRTLHSNGIHLNSLTYNNEWLSRLRNELAPDNEKEKPSVKVKWSASDVGVIYVMHPDTHEFFAVEAKEEGVKGRSLFNHKVILREQRARRKAGLTDDTYLDAELAIHEAIEKLAESKKPLSKKRGARLARFLQGNQVATESERSRTSEAKATKTKVDRDTGDTQDADEAVDFSDELEFGNG